MSEAKEAILARVRQATGGAAENCREVHAEIPRLYKRHGNLPLEEKLSLFEDRLHDYEATVHRCTPTNLIATIGSALRARGKRRILIPPDFPLNGLPEGFEFVADNGLSYSALDTCDGVITASTAAIALTGTIVLQDGLYQGRRALSLVPDYHLCLVGKDQIYETVPEAMQVLAHTGAKTTTFISGPSATSDIEMTRIKGVHGPRTLEVILIL